MKFQSVKFISVSLASFASIICAAPVQATEETTDPYEGMLFSDMHGMRSKLSTAGIDFTLNYKGDFWDAADGGVKRGTAYVGVADLTVNFDNEKILGLPGNTASIQLVNTHGSKPNSFVGSTQGVDNFEVSTPTTFLYEAWVQQNFFNNKLSFLVGLRDLNVEFVETDMSANYISPVMQIGQDFAQSGKNAPSIYPTTSLAARVKVKPTENTYMQAAVFDAVPGDLNDAHGTHININNKDGELLIAEVGITPWNAADGPVANKFAIGAWTYTKQFADFTAVDGSGNPVLNTSQGIYAISSYQFYKDTKDRTLGAFLRAGEANGDVNQVEWAYETGIVGHGWVPTRAESEIGFGIAQAHNSDHYISATGAGTKRNETTFELYYRDQLIPGISLQPDLQYISNPGTTPGQSDATLVGLRMDVNF